MHPREDAARPDLRAVATWRAVLNDHDVGYPLRDIDLAGHAADSEVGGM